MSFDDLDELIDRALRALPPPRAPRRLLPRVLAAAQQRPVRPWYERGWFVWPRPWQIAAIGGLVLLASGSAMLLSSALAPVAEVALDATRRTAGELAIAFEYLRVASGTGRALARPLQPLLAPLVAVVLLMLFACAVFGAALNHVLLGRTSEP